jgi:hypothetical protein
MAAKSTFCPPPADGEQCVGGTCPLLANERLTNLSYSYYTAQRLDGAIAGVIDWAMPLDDVPEHLLSLAAGQWEAVMP